MCAALEGLGEKKEKKKKPLKNPVFKRSYNISWEDWVNSS